MNPTIDKASIACGKARQAVADHFSEVSKMVEIGSQPQRPVEDLALTRSLGTHQLVQSPTVQVMFRALDDSGRLLSLARFQHLRVRRCSISRGFEKQRLTGFEAGSTRTAQATVQAAYGWTRLDRSGCEQQQAAGSAGEQE